VHQRQLIIGKDICWCL